MYLCHKFHKNLRVFICYFRREFETSLRMTTATEREGSVVDAHFGASSRGLVEPSVAVPVGD
jgi:hypothetical protein